jgi:hypothetical protein
MKTRLFRQFSRMQRTAPFGQMFGVDLFEDSRLLRVVMCQLHYDAVDTDDGLPFPLADAADQAMTNANLMLYLLRQHQADLRLHLVHRHRYFHRDSQDPHDGLDLKRTTIHTVAAPDASLLDEQAIDALMLDFCRFIATDPHFALCAKPEVYDLSTAPIEVAIDALTTLPFIHTRVSAPDGGVQ